jgi:ribosomal protein S18 acetylase RimI-like enzyme
MTDIQKYEELSMRAWPSSRTILYDGWIVRLSSGITKRANSINPLYSSVIEMNKKISYCEHLYKKHNLPTVYKLTPSNISAKLDVLLDNSGYEVIDKTSFQILDITDTKRCRYDNIYISQTFSDNWLKDFIRLGKKNMKDYDGHKTIITAIDSIVGYVTLEVDSETIGCAIAVLEGDYLGIFDLVISKQHRGEGYGTNMIETILGWGENSGAKEAYLQVTTENKAALKLYSKIGFREIYQYWYRAKPTQTTDKSA